MINWKLRIKNKTTLVSLIAAIIAFIYQICGILGIVPMVAEDDVTQLLSLIINILGGIGIVVDPTTKGITDSNQAMSYDNPKEDEVPWK